VPILGSQDFVLCIAEKLHVHHTEIADVRRVLPTPTAQQIVSSVATEFGLDKRVLLSGRRPHGELTVARNLGMLLCQSRGQMTLSEIARLFRLGHYTSVATAIGESKRLLGQDRRLRRQFDNIHTHLDNAVESNK
jgi:chromosomal replication initiation ATPase DnaA